VNNAGRGVNVAVVNVDTMQVAKAIRFDTYQSSDGLLLVLLYLAQYSKHCLLLVNTVYY